MSTGHALATDLGSIGADEKVARPTHKVVSNDKTVKHTSSSLRGRVAQIVARQGCVLRPRLSQASYTQVARMSDRDLKDTVGDGLGGGSWE